MALVAPKQAGLLPSRQSGIVPAKQIAALWDPTQLGSALAAWWDPRQGITLNGSTVSAWADRVAGLSATQSTASAQPTYSATARNGKPGLSMTGSQYLTFTPSSAFPSGSAVGVIVAAAYQVSPGNQGTWAVSYGAANSNAGLTRYITTSDSTVGNVAIGVSGSASNLTTAESWKAVDRLVIGQFGAGQTLTANVDGLAIETVTPSPTINTSLSTGRLGGWAYYGSNLNGVLQQIMVINRSLTVSERQKLEGWESWADGKNGANLPSSHPYKSRAPYMSDP